jgi:hypothetical protein
LISEALTGQCCYRWNVVLSFGEPFGDGDVPGKRDPLKRIDAINSRELTDAGIPIKEGLA